MDNGILIVNQTPVPTDERSWLEAKALAGAGYTVSVIAPRADRAGESYRCLEGIHIFSYAPPRQASGIIGYFWEFLYCWVRTALLSIRVSRKIGFQVIHACNPPDTFFLLAAAYKPLKKRFVFAQHDLCPELWQSRFGNKHRLDKLLRSGLLFLESMSYRLADMVITPNESYKRTAMTRGKVSNDAVHIVRNGPDLDKVRIVEPDPSLKRGRQFMIGYLGIMNPQDGIEYLFRAMAYLIVEKKRDDIQIALIGSGDIIDDLKKLALELGIDDYVTFAGWISDSELLSEYLSTADICVAPDPATPLNQVSSFMKIMDYMAVAKPIVAFDLPETKVSAQEAALYAQPNDVIDFAGKIEELLADPSRRAEMGAYGRERVEKQLSWDHSKAILLSAYESLFAGEADLPRQESSKPLIVEAEDEPVADLTKGQ